MKNQIPIVHPLTQMRMQVKACLERESRLTPEERKQHQWQFVTAVAGITYIVGKGGANTMFYQIGIDGSRKVCMPKEMLEVMSSWRGSKFQSYAIRKKKDVFLKGPTTSLKSLLKTKVKKEGTYIVGIKADGKTSRLYVSKKGILGVEWIPFTAK